MKNKYTTNALEDDEYLIIDETILEPIGETFMLGYKLKKRYKELDSCYFNNELKKVGKNE